LGNYNFGYSNNYTIKCIYNPIQAVNFIWACKLLTNKNMVIIIFCNSIYYRRCYRY